MNMNIPNLLGDHHFDNEKSALQRMAELENQKRNKRIKTLIVLTIASGVLATGLFLFENEQKNTQHYLYHNTNAFVVKNHNQYPVMESNIQPIIDVSKLNQQIVNHKQKLEPLFKELEQLNKYTVQQLSGLSSADKMRVTQLRHMLPLLKINHITENDFQSLLILGSPEQPYVNKVHSMVLQSKSTVLELSQLAQKRNELLERMINNLHAQPSYNGIYHWLAILALLFTLGFGGASIWSYINNEKQKLNNEKLELMQENLNIASLINTLMEMDVHNISKIPENEGITGNLINAINVLLQRMQEHNKNMASMLVNIKSLKGLQNQFNKDVNPNVIQESILAIQNNMSEWLQNNNHDDTDDLNNRLSGLNKELQDLFINLKNSSLNAPQISLDDVVGLFQEIYEVDQDLSVVVNNLEIFARKHNNNQFSNMLTFGIMQEKLPKTMQRKLELNTQMRDALMIKHKALSNYYAENNSGADTSSMIEKVRKLLNDCMKDIHQGKSQANSLNQQKHVFEINEHLNAIQQVHNQITLNLKTKDNLINQLLNGLNL